MYKHKDKSMLSGREDDDHVLFVFIHILPVVSTLQFRKQRIPWMTIPLPSIFAEGDYRRVRLTHPNWLVKYCRRESYPYTQARGFYLSRLTMQHRFIETRRSMFTRSRMAQKLKGDATIKRETMEFIAADWRQRAIKRDESTCFQNGRCTSRVTHTSNTKSHLE